jgi:hypothetical protein
MNAPKKFRVVDVLDLQMHGKKCYRLAEKAPKHADAVTLDFSSLPEEKKRKELSYFHRVTGNTVIVRIHQCSAMP